MVVKSAVGQSSPALLSRLSGRGCARPLAGKQEGGPKLDAATVLGDADCGDTSLFIIMHQHNLSRHYSGLMPSHLTDAAGPRRGQLCAAVC